VIDNPTGEDRLVNDVVIPGRTAEGIRVEIVTGESVRIVGNGIDRTWRIGDEANWVYQKYETLAGDVYVYRRPVEKVSSKTISVGSRRVDIHSFVEDQTLVSAPTDEWRDRVRVPVWAKPSGARVRRRKNRYGDMVEWGHARNLGLEGAGQAARCTAHGTVVFREALEHEYHLSSPIRWCAGCKAAFEAEQRGYAERYARHGIGAAR
jgi:hypothetical protein